MITDNIELSFREKVTSEIRLKPEGINRYRVFTPFTFDDGDAFTIVLRQEPSGWILTDEGHTMMHLSYEFDERDLQRGTRAKIIENTLSSFFVQDRDGELIMRIAENNYGDALFSFLQALNKISDLSFLSREQARSTFMEDFRNLISAKVPEPRREFNWHDAVRDSKAKYSVDCRINQMSFPLFIFAMANDDRTRDATIAILQFEKWGIKHRAVGIFEDQESISRKVLSRFTDVCDRQFSSLGARERIEDFLDSNLNAVN